MLNIDEMIGKIYNADCLEIMGQMPDKCVDLTVTSPPYDNLRTYDGFVFDFENTAKQLYRITKDGGVVVWVVGDATINGSETGTSFKQALFFKECGFNLHDTMIYLKDQLAFPDSTRYFNAFEYMFVFSKGKLLTFNPIQDRENKSCGRVIHGSNRQPDGTLKPLYRNGETIKKMGTRWNYWLIYNQKRGIETQHPAIFPEKLANDHIISWSNVGDIVFDPFMGSGTTAKMAIRNGRNFIGIEVSPKYCDIAQKRIDAERAQGKLF